MNPERARSRFVPPSVGLATAFSALGFSFVVAGGLVMYYVFKGFIIDPSNLVGALFVLAFSLVLFLIGWLSLKTSQKNTENWIDYEAASTITTARIIDRGTYQEIDDEGDIYDVYWISFRFNTIGDEIESRELFLKAKVSKKLYDILEPGQSVRIRYANSKPDFVLLEGETREFERSLNPKYLLLWWILANVLGGMVGIYVGASLGADTIFFGAIAGLIIGEAQWIILYKHIPIPNWLWVLSSIVGWAAFSRLGVVLSGLVGGVLLGVIQWLVLRQKVDRAEMWVPFTILGTIAGQFLFNNLAPYMFYVLAGGIFDLAYGGATGIALYLIALQAFETPAHGSSI